MARSANSGLNRRVTGCPVILFAGAGASAALGLPTTRHFMSKVEPLVSRSMSHSRIYTNWLTVGQSDFDIEHLLDYLDTSLDRSVVPQQEKQRLARFRSDLLKLIVASYSGVDTEKAQHLWWWLFLWLKAFPLVLHPLVIFTTNYDWIFERAIAGHKRILNLVDGFRSTRLGTYWDARTFANFRGTKFGWDFIYFKLHGSTSWYMQQDGRIIKTTHGELNPGKLRTMLIYPTLAKRKQVDIDPYLTGYSYLHGCLSSGTKLCVIVGFSFRDGEINEVLRGAVETNEFVDFVIVDPCPDEQHVLNVLNIDRGRVEFVREEFRYYGMNTNAALRTAIERRMTKDSLMFANFHQSAPEKQFDQLRLLKGMVRGI